MSTFRTILGKSEYLKWYETYMQHNLNLQKQVTLPEMYIG